MKKQRKHYTGEEKVAILRRHLLDQEPVSKLCDELGLQPTVFYRWQKELFDHAAAAFEVQGRGKRSDGKAHKLEQTNERLRAKLAHKDNVIAEITQEYVALKKSLGED